MKKLFVFATAAFLMTGVAFAHDGDKKCATKGKDCCKKEQMAKGKSCCAKDAKQTSASAKTAKTTPAKKA
jgi:hypothetical protein